MGLPVRKKLLIQTERLVLKPFSSQDTDRLVDIITNDEIGKTFMVPVFENKEQAVSLVQKLIMFSQPEDTKHLEYGIYLDEEIIGFINDCGVEDDNIEIGYVIHPKYQGHGYATEAVSAVLTELQKMGFHKVTAGFFEGNAASCRVLEKCAMKKSGFVSEEEYRGKVHKCIYYEISF